MTTPTTVSAELPEALPPAFMHYPPKKPELARVDFFPMATKQERGSGWVTIALTPAAQVEALSAAQAGVPALREAVAKAIYDQWAYQDGWVKWVDRGNSLRQDDARDLADLALAAAPQPSPSPAPAPAFQQRVQPWLLECFGAEIAADRTERNHRFLEESLELVQALGCTASEAHQLVDYVFGRPVGDPPQEVGGVMVTLAALCLANNLDMHDAGDVELSRISAPELVAKIRAKQAAKPKHSPLPEAAPAPAQPGQEGECVTPSEASIAWNALRDLTDQLGELGIKIMGHARVFAQRQYECGLADRAARAAPQPATADAVDAKRYRWLREQHEGDDAEETCCVFAPNDMRECLVPVGSQPGELDEFIDAAIAAQRATHQGDTK